MDEDLDRGYVEDEEKDRGPGLLTILIVLLLIISLIGTLLWPVIYNFTRSYRLPPTPVSPFIQEA